MHNHMQIYALHIAMHNHMQMNMEMHLYKNTHQRHVTRENQVGPAQCATCLDLTYAFLGAIAPTPVHITQVEPPP